MQRAYPVGAATGVGSLPGADPLDAAATVVGELPDFVHLAELPARGAGADLVGRAAALLADLHVELQPSGWRLTARPGRDARRARDLLAEDLDALQVAALGYAGPLKLQSAGPWTLAAAVETPRGHRGVADPGARRDMAESLAEGLRLHAADVSRRVPKATVVLQLDEPGLAAVAAGRLPTASGFGAVAAVDTPELVASLRAVADTAAVPTGIHCCADDPRLDVVRAVRPDFVSVDVSRLDPRRDYDHLAGCVDDGATVLCGVVPSADAELGRDVGTSAARVAGLWRDLGGASDDVAARVVITPTCGLAGASPAYARAAMTRAREVARSLADGVPS